MKTGPKGKETFHYEKLLNAAKGITNRLTQNQNAIDNGRAPILTPEDVANGRAHLKEAWDALNRADRTNAVESDLKSRGVHATVENTFRQIASNPAVREQTGGQFEPAANPRDPRLVYRGGGGQFFGRSLAVLGVVGDLPYVWEAGRVMSGKPPNPGMYPRSLLCDIIGCPTVS